MLDDLLALFAIVPDYDLDIMRADQTPHRDHDARLEAAWSRCSRERSPTSCSCTATRRPARLPRSPRSTRAIPVGHVEAGLRTSTHWEPYPEELNRRLTGRIAAYHFAPTLRARQNLERENVAPGDIFVTGNTVIDAFLDAAGRTYAGDPPEWAGLDPARPWIFVTAHRRENHEAMRGICEALAEIAALPQRPQILWPVHPSPKVAPVAHAVLDGVAGVKLVEPMDYDATVRRRALALRPDRQRRPSRGSALSWASRSW